MELSKGSIQFLVEKPQNNGIESNNYSSPILSQQFMKSSSPYKLQKRKPSSDELLLEKWLHTLRVTTYHFLEDLAIHNSDEKKFACIFSTDCSKVIKGRGNLRRHMEWHLRRIEETCKDNKELLFIEER